MVRVMNNAKTYTIKPIGIANHNETLIRYKTIAKIMPQITSFTTVFNRDESGLYSVLEMEYIISTKINISLRTVVIDAPI